MAKIERFEEIEAWKEARKLSDGIYGVTRSKPFRGDASLSDQMRRASVSCMSNISGGFDAGANREVVKFLPCALRSASEVRSPLDVALDQAYIAEVDFARLYEAARAIKSLIGGFRRYLRSHSAAASSRLAWEPGE